MKRSSYARRTSLLPLFLTLWCLAAAAAGAQTMAERQAFADLLNTAVANEHQFVGSTSHLEISVKNVDGGCDTMDFFMTRTKERDGGSLAGTLDGVIQLTYTATTVKLCFTVRDAKQVPVPENSHPLVGDLNNWLDATWALELQGLMTSSLFFSGCTNTVAQQPYFRRQLGTTDNATLRTVMKDATGATDILAANYDVMGTAQSGSSFLSFYETPTYHIADRTNLIARVANPSVTITPPSLSPIKLVMDAHLCQYPSDCGTTNGTAYVRVALNSDVCKFHKNFTGASCSGNADLFDFYVNDYTMFNRFTDRIGKFGSDDEGWLTFTLLPDDDVVCDVGEISPVRIIQLIDPVLPDDKCCITLDRGGEFQIDPRNGELVYVPPASSNCEECCPQPVPCFAFCDPISGTVSFANVIDDFAQTYSDAWPYTRQEFGIDPKPGSPSYNEFINLTHFGNDYEQGERGRWRPQKKLLYRTSIISGNNGTARNYADAGVFDDFVLYNWENEKASSVKWLKRDTVTRYSPHGHAVEEMDALGVYSAARTGYSHTVAKLVAKNARFASVEFESFEEGSGNAPGIAHAGRNSYRLPATAVIQSVKLIKGLNVTQQLMDDGIQVRFWTKSDHLGAAPPVGVVMNNASFSVEKIAQTGEWTLYETKVINTSSFTVGQPLEVFFHSTLGPAEYAWVDDIRVQPVTAQMNCYVYDTARFRPLTTFDDQHFGLFYQYNGEGKLIRKARETERGMKTIAETFYNTPGVERDENFGSSTQGSGGPASVFSRRGAPRFSAEGPESDSVGGPRAATTFDMLDIQIGKDSSSVKVFGQDPRDLEIPEVTNADVKLDRLFDPSAIQMPDIASLPTASLPELDRLKLLEELKGIDEELRVLKEKSASLEDLSDEERVAMEEAAARLREKKHALLRDKLGMTDEDIEQWYRKNKATEDAE